MLPSFGMDFPDSPFPPSDEFQNINNDNVTGSQRRRQSEKNKATWDVQKTRVLLTLTASLIDNGYRRGNALSPSGYNLLLVDFNRITGQSLTTIQLKSKIQLLGKEWRAWMDLKNPHSSVTGMGWNYQRNTWDAPDWWWSQQLQRNPQFVKFRERGLENAELMEKVFGGTAATGEWHWTPSARERTTEDGQGSGIPGQANFVESESDTPAAVPNSEPEARVGTSSGGVRRRRDEQEDTDDGHSGSRRRQSHAARISMAIADMAEALRGRSNETRLVWGSRETSMDVCVAKLMDMATIDKHSELYLFAVDLFTTAINREAFLS